MPNKSKPSEVVSEKQIQDKLAELIKSDNLSDHIKPSEEIDSLTKKDDEDFYPLFSIDHVSRKKCAKAAAVALESLTMLEILTEDKNISITEGEILRPDIVSINPENESIVLFELKKSEQTGRQALTELLAYEQELKNVLPFLSGYETIFVLVSTEWSTLMDHAAASAVVWSEKNLLCLDAKIQEDTLYLEPRIPNAWKITGSRYFPADALPCVTLCLYDYKPSEDLGESEDDFDHRLWTALELIAREGDRLGTHGFTLLWKDFHPLSQASYCITLCGVNPFSFYKIMRQQNILASSDNLLTKKLDQYMTDFDPMGHSESLFTLYDYASPLLKEVSDPKIEGFSDWHTDIQLLRTRAEPLLCEFWGVLGEFARDYIRNSAVRKYKKGWLKNSDWRDPRIGIAIIESFFEPNLFQGGNVRPSDAFKLGLLVGLEYSLREGYKAFKQDKKQPSAAELNTINLLKCRLYWSYYELSAALEEVSLLSNAANNVKPPKTPFKLSIDPEFDAKNSLDDIIDWLKSSFLCDDQIISPFFGIGIEASTLLEPSMKEFLSDDEKTAIETSLEPSLKYIVLNLFNLLLQLEKDGGLIKDLKEMKDYLLQGISVPKIDQKTLTQITPQKIILYWPLILEIADKILDPVFHDCADIAPVSVDWTWLKQGVEEMHKTGTKYPAIILELNGTIATGSLDNMDGMQWLAVIEDPAKDVYFFDQKSGIAIAIKTTWDELQSGKHFPIK